MVFKHPETGLEHFSVDGCRIFKDGVLIATLDSTICQIGRLDDRLFVLLDPYPAQDNPEYAGTNLWCLDDTGHLLWKARNLNRNWKPSKFRGPNCYRSISFFKEEQPVIFAITWDDHLAPFIDPISGQQLLGSNQRTPIEHLIFCKAKTIAWLSPNEPPRPPKLPSNALA